jgi:hypothetical protein
VGWLDSKHEVKGGIGVPNSPASELWGVKFYFINNREQSNKKWDRKNLPWSHRAFRRACACKIEGIICFSLEAFMQVKRMAGHWLVGNFSTGVSNGVEKVHDEVRWVSGSKSRIDNLDESFHSSLLKLLKNVF